MIVDIEDGDPKWLGLDVCGWREQALQESRGDGYVVDEAVSTAERSPHVMAGWTAQGECAFSESVRPRRRCEFLSGREGNADRGNDRRIGRLGDGTTEVKAVVTCSGDGRKGIDVDPP